TQSVDRVLGAERSRGEPYIDDHALVGVVVAVEDQTLDRRCWVALRRRDPFDDRLEDVGYAGSVLRAREDHLSARDGQDVLELFDDRVGVGRREVDLVQDRDQGQVLAQREMHVRERLSLYDPRRI